MCCIICYCYIQFVFHGIIIYCIHNIYFFDKRSLTIIYIYYDQGSFRSFKVMHCLGERFDKLLPVFWFDIEYSVSKYQDLNTLSFCLFALMLFVLLTFKLKSSYVFLYNYVYILGQLCFDWQMISSY